MQEGVAGTRKRLSFIVKLSVPYPLLRVVRSGLGSLPGAERADITGTRVCAYLAAARGESWNSQD
jgi:hypothetical protein